MPAPDASPSATALDLASLLAHLERRATPLDEAAARALGHALAARLAEAHATLDAEGNPAPVIDGHLGPGRVRVDATGEVSLAAAVTGDEGAPGTAPESLPGARLTPRADVYALGAILQPLLAASPDPDLLAALATAVEPLPARRRITCVELEAWLARGADLDAGHRALGDAVRDCLDARDDAAAPPPASQPLPAPVRVAVTLVTAAAVFAAGIAVVERWLGR